MPTIEAYIDLDGRIGTKSWVNISLYYRIADQNWNLSLLTGDSRLLAIGVAMDNTPAEVLWDRLMEYPAEISKCAHPELIPEIIAELRRRHRPDGG